jgi:hypothetical protein
LVGRIPHRFAVAEGAHEAGHVAHLDGAVGPGRAVLAEQVGQHGIIRVAVEAADRRAQGEHATGDLERREVAGDQQHAAAGGQGFLQRFDAFDAARGQGGRAAPPATRDFQDAEGEGLVVATRQRVAGGLRQLRETDAEVDEHHMATDPHDVEGEGAESGGEAPLPGPRQPGDKPEATQGDAGEGGAG